MFGEFKIYWNVFFCSWFFQKIENKKRETKIGFRILKILSTHKDFRVQISRIWKSDFQYYPSKYELRITDSRIKSDPYCYNFKLI